MELDQLYAYDLTIELPAGVTFVSAEDNLSGGLPVSVIRGNKLRYGSTKSGQAAGENGTRTLTRLALKADDPGNVDIKLVKVKSIKNLVSGLRGTVHEVNKTLSVSVTSDDNGNGNTKAHRDITEEDGNDQVESGKVVIHADGPVRVSMELLQKWAKQNSSAVVELKVGNISYSLPLSDMISGAWRNQLGDQADKAVITIIVTEASEEQADKAEREATQNGATLLMKPIDFDVIAETPTGDKVTITWMEAKDSCIINNTIAETDQYAIYLGDNPGSPSTNKLEVQPSFAIGNAVQTVLSGDIVGKSVAIIGVGPSG